MAKCLSRYVPLVILGICFVRIGPNCTADDVTKQRFLTEYPREAKILKGLWDRCSGSYRLVSPDGKRLPNDFSADFFRSHGFEKVELKGAMPAEDGPLKISHVYCVGDDGSFFVVNKSRDRADYQVRKVSSDESSINMYEQKMGRCIRAFLGGHRKPLITMLEEKTATLVDANPVTGKSSLIEATFHVTDGSPVTQLVARFDTTNHWAVEEQDLYVKSPPVKTLAYRVEYGEKQAGVAMPRKIHVSENNYPYVFNEWKFEATPRDAFSMTHYGLSDLVEANRIQNEQQKVRFRIGRLAMFLIVGVIVAILSGVAFLLLSNRSDRPQSERSS